jgi:putative transposase
MSRKGDCCDNALTESLWGSLKRACVYSQRFRTREKAKAAVMNRLAFYNATRLHLRRGHVSSMQFEKNWLAEQARCSA